METWREDRLHKHKKDECQAYRRQKKEGDKDNRHTRESERDIKRGQRGQRFRSKIYGSWYCQLWEREKGPRTVDGTAQRASAQKRGQGLEKNSKRERGTQLG